MANLGVFDQEVVGKLNVLLKKFSIAPGYGNDDECTYYVGRYSKKLGCVEDWVSLDCVDEEKWGDTFFEKWNEIKGMTLFTGEIYALECPKYFLVGDKFETKVVTSDRVVRCFRKETTRTVIDVLGQAYHILYDPENRATGTQGAIGKISIKDTTIPTLVFEFDDR
jgi:hypothetical protein